MAEESSPIDPSALDLFVKLRGGWLVSRALHAAAELGVADVLSAGAKTIEQVAEATGANPQALYRVLLREPEDEVCLAPGETYSVWPKRPHFVTNGGENAGTFQFGYTGGDLTSITDPLGHVITRFTDSVGRLLSVTDPLGNTTSYSYDAMNHLTGISDLLGDTTTLAYDADDKLASVSDLRGNTTSYAYEGMDRRASRTDPLSASAS